MSKKSKTKDRLFTFTCADTVKANIDERRKNRELMKTKEKEDLDIVKNTLASIEVNFDAKINEAMEHINAMKEDILTLGEAINEIYEVLKDHKLAIETMTEAESGELEAEAATEATPEDVTTN